MARPLRIEYPGAFYHVINRRLSRRDIFMEDKGRQGSKAFIERIRERLGDKARVDEEKPQSRQVFGLEIEEVVEATVREYGKGVDELKRRKRGGQNEARMVAIYLSRQLGGHKHREIGKAVVGLDKASSVSSAYLRMKARVTEERQLTRRIRRIEKAFLRSKRTSPFCLRGLGQAPR
jgi:hypothetical protein